MQHRNEIIVYVMLWHVVALNGLIASNKGNSYRGIWYHCSVQWRVRAEVWSFKMILVLYAVIPPVPRFRSWVAVFNIVWTET